ncbi:MULTISPECIES: DUF4199 domain-containing protein [Hymenobacter]|uniref:DUF4199 domain-containing protein n=1 Tax=Hymenobacter mucosus TaxID=1411120 RepID=A0A238Y1D0_9BACT|nr:MULTISPECIES: DUF4199 domain-containing protein [Hymenobacter]SNR64782.1 Protein of unknown function [Hymenobacter mucosus]
MTSTTTSVSPTTVGLRYGLITGLVITAVSFLQLALISDPETPLRWLSGVVLGVGIVLAHKRFKQLNGGFMSYGEGLGIGAVLAAVAGLLSSFFSFLYLKFVDPDYMNRVMELTRSRLEDRGMEGAQVDQAIASIAKYSTGPISIVFGALGALLLGFFLTLAISAFTKHTRPEFE